MLRFVRWIVPILILGTIVFTSVPAHAQGPKSKSFGFGLMLGEPSGLTAKLWLNKENSLVFDLGASYFGSPRIQVDYLWHFDTFSSPILKLYAGPGVSLGFDGPSSLWRKSKDDDWYYRDNEMGLGVRVVAGLNIIPKNSPLEIFAEIGENIGIMPGFGAGFDAAVGLRFYP